MSCRIFIAFQMMVLLSAAQSITESVGSNAKARPNPQRQAARYVCPMHREVSSAKSGRCPKCGMALQRVNADKVDAGAPPTSDNVSSETNATISLSSSKIPDIKVFDQNGNLKYFYTDLIKGNTVAINFIFTTCTTICPPLTAAFRRVQRDLAERALDVRLISISVDPATDTTERLREFAEKFKAGPGWTFVTGDREGIDSLLQALGSAVADKNDHTPLILIGNDVTGYWTRAYGLSSPALLLKVISEAASRK